MSLFTMNIGKPSEKDSDQQENDVTFHNEYQEDINDFKNIEPDHHERLRDLTHEIDNLRQKVKANKSEPMDAISHLEHKLNRIGLTLHPSTPLEAIEEVLQQYTDKIMYCPKENVLCKHLTPKYSNF